MALRSGDDGTRSVSDPADGTRNEPCRVERELRFVKRRHPLIGGWGAVSGVFSDSLLLDRPLTAVAPSGGAIIRRVVTVEVGEALRVIRDHRIQVQRLRVTQV